MRVTHVITRLIVGGAQENTIASVLGLQRRHHLDVRLLSGPTSGPEGSLESHVANAHLEIVPSLVRPIHPWLDLRAYFDLSHRFRLSAPHIVHTHSGKAGFIGRLAARRARVPIIVHTIHGPSFGPFQNPLPNTLFLSAERLAARSTTHFVSVANAMSRLYLQAGIAQPHQFSCIHSGFNLNPCLNAHPDPALRAQLGISHSDFVIGTVARLFKLKGHHDLLAIAPNIITRLPNARFLLVGDGPLRPQLQQAIHNLRLAHHFVFAGLVPPDTVHRYLALMDVLVHLSRREGLPRALPQAMATSRPVIALNLHGAPEVCLHNVTGFLVEPGDLATLSAYLLQLAQDPPLRQRLGRQGRDLVSRTFSEDLMVDKLYQLYRRLLQSPHIPHPSPSL